MKPGRGFLAAFPAVASCLSGAVLLGLSFLGGLHAVGQTPFSSVPRVDAAFAPAEPSADSRAPGAREVLAQYGLTGTPLERFVSGTPIAPDEEEILAQLLYYLPRLGDDALAGSQQVHDLDTLAASPQEHRLEAVHLRGTVVSIQRVPLLPELAERMEFDHYYQVHLTLHEAPYDAVVCVRRVPAALKDAQPQGEPCAADALFLKVGEVALQRPQLVFAALRLAWLPDRVDPQRGIGPEHVALARLGMDQGLWEDVRAAQRKELSPRDREAFYQALVAVGRPEAAPKLMPHQRPLDLVALLEQPDPHLGQVVEVEGTARRVVKVAVTDPAVRNRFQIEHYFQIDLFVPLGPETSIRLGADPTGEKNPVFHNNFPTTMLARHLPPGLAEGENLRVPIRAHALFFKVWAYRSPYAARFGQLQPAPLFMAIQTQVLPPFKPTANWVTSLLVTLAMGLALGMLALVVWWVGGGQHSSARSRRRVQGNAPQIPVWAAPSEEQATTQEGPPREGSECGGGPRSEP